MRTVLSEKLWIGNAGDLRTWEHVLSANIAAVVDLAMEEPPGRFPREIIWCRIPLVDGAGNPTPSLRIAVQTVGHLIDSGLPTLVACGGGMSRSPAVVATALARVRGDTPEAWLQQIAASGPHDVAPGLWNDLRQI